MANPEKNNYRKKISRLVYIPATLSFIPGIGIPFSVSALLWGISDWKIGGKKAVTIAIFGLLLSSLLFGWYVFFMVDTLLKSASAIENKTEVTKASLAFVMRYIEYYKLGHGHYPNSLDELREKDFKFVEHAFIDAFTTPWIIPRTSGGQQFFYEVQEDGNTYDLFSIGPDKTPHTQDDIYPVVLDDYKPILGLRTTSVQSP